MSDIDEGKKKAAPSGCCRLCSSKEANSSAACLLGGESGPARSSPLKQPLCPDLGVAKDIDYHNDIEKGWARAHFFFVWAAAPGSLASSSCCIRQQVKADETRAQMILTSLDLEIQGHHVDPACRLQNATGARSLKAGACPRPTTCLE